jgi:hypothetical protein
MICFKPTRSKILLLLLAAAIVVDLVSSACGLRKPQAPSWMTTWDIPLANRIYTISEILDDMDNDNIVFNDSGSPTIQLSQNLDTTTVAQNLKVEPTSMNLMDSVGILEVAPPENVNTFTNLSDVMDIGMGIVPPAPFETIQSLGRIDNFTWAHIEQGMLDVTFHNALEIDLDTFIVILIDSVDMHQIGTLVYLNGLSYLETETQQLDISGQTISNSIFMQCHGHTPGGLLINAGSQRLESEVSFPNNLLVSSACARIVEFTHTEAGRYEIEDSTKINSSLIYQGNLNLQVTNNSNLPYNVILRSSNFKWQGSDFAVNRRLEPHNLTEITIDLSGYVFTPEDSAEIQFVTVEMINTMIPSEDQEYIFRSSDSLNLHVDVSQILLESVSGRIKPIPITMDTVTCTLDLPQGLEQTTLTHANVNLSLSNNCMVAAFAEITVTGNGRSLHLNGLVPGKDSPGAPPAVTSLSPSQEELAAFFDPPPSNLVITGRGTLNPNYEIVTIRRSDNFWGEFNFQSALAFAIRDTVELKPEISKIEPNTKHNEFSYGQFDADLSNHLPIGAMVTFFIGCRSDSTLYTDPNTIKLGPYQLSAAQTDANGFVSEPVNSTISDSLGTEASRLFERDSLFVSQRVELLPTPSSGVIVVGSDNIRVGARARIQMLLGGD